MGHFYRFYYMFLVALKILSFPSVILFLHDLRRGWARWYRSWRNYIFRFGGWLTIRRWTMQVDKDDFLRKLREARRHLARKRDETHRSSVSVMVAADAVKIGRKDPYSR
jgi:hypothetical protein